MQFSLVRTEFAHGAAVTVVNIAALALLALTGAYWSWQWFAPRAEPLAPVQAEPGGQIAAALDLFGTIQRENIIPVSTGNAIRLLGVVAATEGRDAYAIVVLDDKQIIATRKGEDIVPGLGLVEVTPDHVILDRNGIRESLALPEKPPVPENAAQRAIR